MGAITVAEWIETQEMAKAARAMGFQQGQGQWLGAPLREIPVPLRAVGKRRGIQESWG
jgi:EAL domain-containing protein (putative c-di-GMP-specific phosphodiesterase class I)